MALRVWLPLTGNLENKGISDLNFSNTNTSTITINNAGKIGSCYSRATAESGGYIISDKTILLNDDISMCCWAKVIATDSGDTANGLISNHSHEHNTGFGINVKKVSDSDYRISCSTGTGSSRTYYTYYGTTNIKNEWHHLALTYNNNTHIFQLWVDGQVEKTQSYTNGARADYIRIFDWSTTYNSARFQPACMLNDVRIYDHCLSAAEVKEISQGLVLHYKLDDAVGFTDIIQNQNTYVVYNNYSGSGTTGTLTNLSETFYGNVVRREVMTPNDTSVSNFRTSLGSHGVYGHGQTFLANTKYVFWIYYRPVSHMDIRVGGTASNIGGWTEIPPVAVGNGWYRVGQYRNGTVTTDKTDNIFTSFYTPTAASGVPITIDWASPHLLQGTIEIPSYGYPSTIIQDSSGYGHNGNIYGATQLISGSPRYSTAIELTSTSSHINASGLVTSGFGSSYSFVWWAKSNSTTNMHWGFSDGIRLNGLYNGNLWNTGDGSNNPLYKPGTTTGISVTEANVWHHWAMTGDGTTCKVYKDGVHVANAKTWKAISGTSLWFNGWQNSTNYAASSLALSDFRLYATALSANDIAALYHTAAKIDNLGGLHTFELNENGSNKLTKTGIFKDYMVEPFITLADGSKWQLMLYHYVDGGNNLFTQSNATFCNDFGLYSRLAYIDNFKYGNLYEFYVLQDDIEYRWTQTSKPTATSIAGLTTVSGYTNPVNGLAKPTSLTQTYIGYSSWWGACGCWTSYSTGGKTGIPGFGAHSAAGMCTKYLALYARISEPKFHIANLTAYLTNLIER